MPDVKCYCGNPSEQVIKLDGEISGVCSACLILAANVAFSHYEAEGDKELLEVCKSVAVLHKLVEMCNNAKEKETQIFIDSEGNKGTYYERS